MKFKKSSVYLFWQRIRSYFRYIIKARHYKGFGIHSPFVFYLVRELFFATHPYDAFVKINAARRMLLGSDKKVGVRTFGASSVNRRQIKKISLLVKEGSMPPKYGKLLFRLINHFQCCNILELGTGMGLGTLFLALPNSAAKVTSIEANGEMCSIADRVFEMAGVKNVRQLNGKFINVLPTVLDDFDKLDFVLFDGDHRLSATLQYFEMCLSRIHNDTIFVFDDIHWSDEMEDAWNVIIAHPLVTVSIDLYRLGIVFFRNECSKQHYIIRY